MQKTQSQTEFILLMALLMSMVALSIDAILPASEMIGRSVGIDNSTDRQLLVPTVFLGLGIGQLFFGPVSDSIGRKPTILIGFAVFIIASFICVNAESLDTMLFGRVLQGVGLSAARTVCIAMVRDTFSGDQMGKIMSFITMIFLITPIVAPSIGKIILNHFGWKSIFNAHMLYSTAVVVWLYIRQPETLDKSNRRKFKLSLFKNGVVEFFKFPAAIIYTVISGLISGAFMVYLSASKDIYTKHFNMGENFPYLFASMALCSAFGTFLNAKFVLKVGMKKIVMLFLSLFFFIPLIYIILFYNVVNPRFEIFLLFCGLQLFCIGFLFGNLRSLAMEPLGHIAGIGASTNGFISTIISVPIAILIGKYIHGSSLPVFIGYCLTGLASILLIFIFLKNKKNNIPLS